MSSEILQGLLSQAGQVAILTLLVWLIVRTFAKGRSHLAHALWALVLIKCITPPLWSSPTGIFSWLLSPVTVVSTSETTDGTSQTRSTAESIPVATDGKKQQEVSIRVAPLHPSATALHRVEASHHTHGSAVTGDWHWGRSLCVIWLAGVLISLVVLLVRFALFLNRLRSLPVVDAGWIEGSVRRLAQQLGLCRDKLNIKIIDGAIGPAVLGWWRPTILLPRLIVENKPLERIEPLLAHEMIHVRRGDLWWSMLQAIAKSVWWFFPPVWAAARMQAREAEQSCDEETIAGLGCEPGVYARILLDVLEQKNRLHVAPALPGVRPVEVTAKRLERIMRLEQGSCGRRSRWIWLLLVLAGLAVLPGTGLVWADDEDSVPAAPALPKVASEPEVLPNPPKVLNSGQPDYAVSELEVESILKRLVDSGLSPEKAESKLLDMLPLSTADSLDRSAALFVDGFQIELGGGRPRMKIHHGKLYVFDTAKLRTLISGHVEHYRRFGLDSLQIEAKLIRLPADAWDQLDISWNLTGANAATDNAAAAVANPGSPPMLPARAADSDAIRDSWRHGVERALDVFDARASRVQHASATTVTRKSSPLMIATVNADQAARLVRSIKGGNTIAAPKIMTLNGREAVIEIGQTRLFTVGYQSKKDDDGNQIYEPVVSPLKEGTEMKVQPVLTDDDQVQLQLFLQVSQLRNVQTAKLPIKQGGKQLQVEIPEATTSNVQTAIQLELGKTLVLGGISYIYDGQPHRLLCLVDCQKANLDQDVRSSKPNPAKSPDDYSLDLPPSETKTLLPRPWKRRLEKQPKQSDPLNPVATLRLLGKSKPVVELSGDLSAQNEGNQTIVQGDQIKLRWENNDQIQSDHAQIRIEGDNSEAKLSGHVRISIGRVQLTADQVQILGEAVQATGGVNVKTQELRVSGNQLVWRVGDTIALKGQVEFRSDNGPELSAESIEFDPELKTIKAMVLKKLTIKRETSH